MKDLKITKGEWKHRNNALPTDKKRIEIFANPVDGSKNHINVIATLEEQHYDANKPSANYSQDTENLLANTRLLIHAPELLQELIISTSRLEGALKKASPVNAVGLKIQIRLNKDLINRITQ